MKPYQIPAYNEGISIRHVCQDAKFLDDGDLIGHGDLGFQRRNSTGDRLKKYYCVLRGKRIFLAVPALILMSSGHP